MTTHTLRLVYDGLGSTQHKMPPSLEKQITVGSQEFLGAHAYFFTEGQIPANIQDHSKRFQLLDLRQRDACWEASYLIDILPVASEFLSEYRKDLTKNLASDAALATKAGFLYLLHASYTAWKERHPMNDRSFDRVEPVFMEVKGNRAPIIGTEDECATQRRILFERTDSSIAKMTAPIGRAALSMEIYFDDIRFDRHDQRHYSEREISAALIPIRARQDRQILM